MSYLLICLTGGPFICCADMVPLYETLVADSVLDLDQSLLDSMRHKTAEELKKLDEKWVNFVLLH